MNVSFEKQSLTNLYVEVYGLVCHLLFSCPKFHTWGAETVLCDQMHAVKSTNKKCE